MKGSFVKKFFFGIGVFFLLVIGVALALPFIIPVDKYRPLLVNKANEQLNGNLEIGKLDLSIWGKLQIKIDGIKLTDAQKRPVLAVQDAQLVLPWISLLRAKPELQLVLKQPRIEVVAQSDGKMNVNTLMKSQAATPTTPGNTQAPAAQSGSGEIPAIALAAKLTLVLEKAAIDYRDEKNNDHYKVDDLNLVLREISLSSKMPFELSATTNLVLQKTIKVNGPILLRGSVFAKLENGTLQKTELTLDAIFDQLDIDYPGTFTKKRSVPFNMNVEVFSDPQKIDVPNWKLNLAEIALSGKASVAKQNTAQNLSLNGKIDSFRLNSLAEILPAMKGYSFEGTMKAGFQASGPTDKIAYAADVSLSKVRFSNDALKQPMQIDGEIKIETDKIKSLALKMASQGFDLTLRGAVEGFTKPHFQFEAVSNQMDLDALLKASAAAEEKRKEQVKAQQQGGAATTAASTKAPVVDYNAMLAPLRENPSLAGAAGTFAFNLSKLKTTGIQVEQIQGKFALSDLQLALKDFSAKIFDGTLGGMFSVDVKPLKPKVAIDFSLKNFYTKKMLESQVPFARNTVKGIISAKLNIGGNGLNSSDIIQTWKGGGNLNIDDAIFSTFDIGKQIRDGFVEKLPGPIKSQVHISDRMVDWRGEYKQIALKYSLDAGEFRILDLDGKAISNKGLDAKGKGKVQLANYGLDMELEFIDTYQMLNADKLAKDPKYGHFTLPTRLGGTLFSPKFDWAYAASRLAKNAFKEKAQEKAKAVIQKVVPGLGPNPNAKDAVKAFKGLFKR